SNEKIEEVSCLAARKNPAGVSDPLRGFSFAKPHVVRFAPIATDGYQHETPGREYQEQTPFLPFRRTTRPRTSATSYREEAGLEGREYRRLAALTIRFGSPTV